MTKLFLDTTIQIEKIFGRDRYEISKYLKENDVLTSSYVLMEFKRTILKDCIALHSYLKEEGDLESTFIRLSELRVHEHRIASRISKILSGMCGQDSIEYEKVLERLEDLIESELLEYFFYNVETIDETKCGLAKEEISKNEIYSLDLSCRRGHKKCEIRDFIAANREEFCRLLEGLQSNREFEKVCDSLKEVLEDPEKARGRKNCWRLGDCIISIESPKTHTILTTDHHYGIICNSLEKPVLSLQQIVTTPHPTQARLQV
ncbi:MAG: hypothetical protein JRI38_05390 [Deltaproteobacteria bacterium]|nr:hypothetical protein [Deltaproteobacteria bacterium]